jgi:hypothetical protein
MIAVAIASPYAVFRAVDLGWPVAMPAPPRPSAPVEPAGVSRPPRRRQPLARRRHCVGALVIQGSLF